MSATGTHVVYIEDDPKLARLTRRYLETHDVRVTHFAEPRAGLAHIVRSPPDVILLDLMLPGIDGLQICRELREHVATPILIVTARGEEADRVMGLEGGADDYISKPFSPRELLARIRVHARRARGEVGPRQDPLSLGPIWLDPRSRSARLHGQLLSLTTYEFDLLRVLLAQPGRVFTREQLVEQVRGAAEESFDRSIDVHISHLRKKLDDDPRRPSLLRTIRGVGYVLGIESQ